MSDTAAGPTAAATDDFAAAAEAITEWDRGKGIVTGLWIDKSVRAVNVGIAQGDEIETTEELQRLVPAGIRVRARPATEDVVKLRQVQVEVSEFLDANGIWGRWAVALGPDPADQVVQLGLLPSTPPEVVAEIRRHFPSRVLTVRTNARHAIAR